MRAHLAHRYFDTDHAIVQDVVDNELSRCSKRCARSSGGTTGTGAGPDQDISPDSIGTPPGWSRFVDASGVRLGAPDR
jgi:hypothetical protein